MRQIVITKAGGPEVLRLETAPDPVPSAGEVVVEVKAAGVNFADILARRGQYPDAPPLPTVVGYEVAGLVTAVGAGVEATMVGQAVIALTRFKGYAERVKVPSGQVFPKPPAFSFEEAAALPVNYLTAYQLLVVMGSLQPDEAVLIHNAGGGVGLAALEIAKHIGATTYGTASGHKHALLKERGLDYALDYRKLDWARELKRLTAGRGVELIIDPLGGGHWRKSYRALRSTGRLGMFGISTVTGARGGALLSLLTTVVRMPIFHPLSLLNTNKGVFGVNVGHLWHEIPKVKVWMDTVLRGVDEGWVRPYVDRAFRFDQASHAHTYIETRQNTGKVVLIP